MSHKSKEVDLLGPPASVLADRLQSRAPLFPVCGAGGSELIAEAPNSNKPSRFTIKDVAQLAGVSTATVSNVVNNTGKVGRATRERVRAAIESMNWKPDKNARNLAKR